MKYASIIEIPGVRFDALNGVLAGDTISIAPVKEWVQQSMDAGGGTAPLVEHVFGAAAYTFAQTDGASVAALRLGRVVLYEYCG